MEGVIQMLRITMKDEMHGSGLIIEGRLTGAWAAEAERYWNSLLGSRGVVALVDVRGVMAIDATGKALLEDIHRRGVRLVTRGCLMNSVVAEIVQEDQRPGEGRRRREA